MNGSEYVWLAPLIAFLVPAIGWGFREYWQHRNAKRQAAGDASKILSDKKKLLKEMVSKAEAPDIKKNLLAQLDEVNHALLGLYGERLRNTLKDAGYPPQEMLIADGLSQLQSQEAARLKVIVDEINKLPPFTSTRYLLFLGNTYYLMRRYEDAKDIYSKIIDLNPSDHNAFQYRGTSYFHIKKYKEALADLNRALELNPDDYIAIHDRGVIFRRLGQYDEALADLNRALEFQPDNTTILLNRGATYIHMKKRKEALIDLNRVLELKPDDSTTLYNLACLFSLFGKTEDALVYLGKAIDKDKKWREEAKTDEDLDNIHDDPRFKKLIGPD
jgi:tetratricopeptide (TPR) repeat protein